jgi:hypothetical protein
MEQKNCVLSVTKRFIQNNIANIIEISKTYEIVPRPSDRLIRCYDSDTGPVCVLSSILVSMVQW